MNSGAARLFAGLKKIASYPVDLLSLFSNWIERLLSRNATSKRKGKKNYGSNALNRAQKMERSLKKAIEKVIDQFVAFSNQLERMRPKKPKITVNTASQKKDLQLKLEQQATKRARADWWKKWWLSRFIRFLSPPFVFVWALLKTRDPVLLWWALPIVLLIGSLSGIVYQTSFVDSKRIAARYEFAVAEAIKAGEFQTAELFQRKLEQLGINTDQGEFRQAFELGETGDMEGAADRMRKIASPVSPGHPGAHFWLAQQLIDENLQGFPPPTNFELALQHVEQLKVRVGDMPEVQFVEAISLAKLGRLDEASIAFGESPSLYLDAAAAKMEVEIARNNMTGARLVAITVQRHLSLLKDEEKDLTEVQYQLEVQSAQLTEDANAVALAIERWYQANPDSDEARLFAAAVKLREFDQWLEDPVAESVDEAAAKIIDVSESIPRENVDLVRRRLNSISRARENPIIESLYQQLVDSADLTGNSMEFFATAAIVRKEWVIADQMFATAAERDAEHATTWNNWAYVIDQAFPERREEGLKYAESATAMQPDNADFRETRGSLLLHLERWEEAIEQLEIALNGLVNSGPIHRSLAEAYEKMGNKRMADLHRREAER